VYEALYHFKSESIQRRISGTKELLND
jgi:hypothetical protein